VTDMFPLEKSREFSGTNFTCKSTNCRVFTELFPEIPWKNGVINSGKDAKNFRERTLLVKVRTVGFTLEFLREFPGKRKREIPAKKT
jgi:hypothetical protein